MALTASDVQKIARLSRLALSDAELEATEKQLNNVFDMIAKMQMIPTEGVQPLRHPHELALRLRDDTVSEENHREHYQECAPLVQAGLYLVPKVLD